MKEKTYALLIHGCPHAVKQSFDLEEYSLSQSTLEQVGPFQGFYSILGLQMYNVCIPRCTQEAAWQHPLYFFPLLQVFLELSKEQELDDFDGEADLSVKWKLLPGDP